MSDVSQLPELPSTPGSQVDCEATVVEVDGRRMLALPYRAGFGRSRGRKFRITGSEGSRLPSQVVMVVRDQAMVPFPGSAGLGDTVCVRLRCLRQRPRISVPADLATELEAARLSVDVMSAPEAAQFLTMIHEAKDPEIRSQRIDTTIAAIRQRTLETGRSE
ncbi:MULTISPECIES: YdeI/OmpD-associated family protein [Arthrobacter]|uniref:DUF1905 domain-containing protein n=1 Tax=Arthrobacter terricola TaxID=2547396 RepID=A0A4R5KCE2_9MICC|nr:MULTISPECIES: YdeI/OmpD-associated family protein [Arthrobacter]MBT8162996.1 YdeI/OmpD-associated family protein [Arthrobacter sp. GN70]TDF91797.1 hypothetical protein E1809_19965 [Arthrobacter terricola]